MDRMKIMEDKLDSQQQSSATATHPRNFQTQQRQPRYNRGRGRCYGRGNFGRDNQYDNNNSNQNFRGGSFRGSNRVGAIGRGASCGSNTTKGNQPLN